MVIVATIAQIAWLHHKTGKVEPMHGSAWADRVVRRRDHRGLHNETFIKWKPTVLYWLMAGSLAGRACSFFRRTSSSR